MGEPVDLTDRPPTLSREQVLALRAELTMGDLAAAEAAGITDPQALARFSLHRRALILGYIAEDVDEAGFLDLVRVTDLAEAYRDEVRDPTLRGIGAASRSPSGGDSDPGT